jgi:hypothetical protein
MYTHKHTPVPSPTHPSAPLSLCREVRIVVEGVADKSNAVLGTVFYPEADKPVNLAEQLVTAGLARVRRCTGCRPRPGPVLSMWWRQRLRLA